MRTLFYRFKVAQQLSEPFHGDSGDQRLLVFEMGVRGRVADPCFAGYLAQTERADAFSGEDLSPALIRAFFRSP